MFQAPKLTDAGKNLYYRNMAGEGIKFTTIQLGNGTISGPISAMTALVSAVVTIDAAVKNNAEQYADVSGHFSNAELEEGFYWREIGVFAAGPAYPNDRSHDILYCYQNAYDTADFIPVASVETVEKNITVPIIVGDASTVSCTLSSSQVLVSEADLEAHDKDANAHNALFEKINKELGITIVVVTHQMEVVRKACNKACILENGKIADEGTVKEIFIKQPQSLRRLLGEEEEKLPDTGHNIQISYLVKDMKDGELFSTMTSELQYVFPIVNGLIQDYQGDQMGIFVINIDDEHLGAVTDYLNQKGIKWRELSGEQGETEVNE